MQNRITNIQTIDLNKTLFNVSRNEGRLVGISVLYLRYVDVTSNQLISFQRITSITICILKASIAFIILETNKN